MDRSKIQSIIDGVKALFEYGYHSQSYDIADLDIKKWKVFAEKNYYEFNVSKKVMQYHKDMINR